MSSDMASLGDSEKETSMLASGCQAAAPPANPQSNVETLTSGKVRASSSFRFLFNLQKIVEKTQRTTTVLDISTCQAVQKVQTLVKHLSERRGMKNFPQPRAGKRVENFSSLKNAFHHNFLPIAAPCCCFAFEFHDFSFFFFPFQRGKCVEAVRASEKAESKWIIEKLCGICVKRTTDSATVETESGTRRG